MSKKLDSTNKDEILAAGKSQTVKEQGKEDKSRKFTGSGKSSKKWGKSGRGGQRHEKRVNDPNWYVPNAQIAKDVASLPFAVYNGVTYNTFTNNAFSFRPNVPVTTTTAPGVFVYKYSPWYGTATPTSALNLTMRALYSFVRHANSGKTNYEAPDLMLYVMAMDNVYLLIHEIKRLIRLAYYYNLENRDLPEKVFDVLNVDTQDLIGNIANYRAQLNTRIAKANSLAVPANFNLFKRRAVFGSVVLTDEPNRPTQLIIPQADGYFMYEATQNQTGGQLVYKQLSITPSTTVNKETHVTTYGNKITLAAYFRLLDSMLTVLLSDEDINIMSGDIIKAYGDNLFKLPFIEENELQEITHDENLLLQFSNSIVLDLNNATFKDASNTSGRILKFQGPGNVDYALPRITQSGGSLVARAFLTYSTIGGVDWDQLNQLPLTNFTQFFLDTSESNSITPENILEWTRLMMAVEPSTDLNSETNFTLEAGVEIGIGWLVGVPSTYYNTSGWQAGLKSSIKTVVTQFFQFSTVDYPGYQRPLAAPTNLSVGATYCAFLYIQDDPTGKSAPSKSYRHRNNYYVQQAILGLNYGPKHYLIAGIDIVAPVASGKPQTATVFFDGSISKMYEKTALISPFNIRSMHDVALLGLISSPYIANSK